jgi:thiosulfate dehydrogenase
MHTAQKEQVKAFSFLKKNLCPPLFTYLFLPSLNMRHETGKPFTQRWLKGAIASFPVILSLVFFNRCSSPVSNKKELPVVASFVPDTTLITNDSAGSLVRYGLYLMLNTSYYIGPDGINGRYTFSKTNCTNCHQNAGAKPFSFDLVASQDRYPQYRAREDKVLTLADRVNNCIERPLNGKPLPLNSREMLAFLAYFNWLDSVATASKNDSLNTGWGKSVTLPFIDRAADTSLGAVVYTSHCSRCHGEQGEGKWAIDSSTYQYPPLWGRFGYQAGSSMYRITKMAGWLKANMPYDSAQWNKPVLTDEEAFDVAAFVNSQPRPAPVSFDYPNPLTKPIDYDKGPYADSFSVQQHKYGPYQPIIDYWKRKGMKAVY